MKRFLLLPLVLLSLAVPHPHAQGERQLLSDAQRAYTTGDIVTAKLKFSQVLAADPSNFTAKAYMKMIKAAEDKDPKSGNELQRQLDGLVLSKVEFKDATFGTALEYLKQNAARESGGKVKVNFVVQLPADFVNTQTVTLNLGAVPFTEVLRYLGDLANVNFSVEKYAILVKKKEAAGGDTAEQAATPAASATQ